MYKMNRSIVPAFMLAGVLAGCASAPPYTPEPFTPITLEPTAYTKKVDNFVIILDSSSSMNERHQGNEKFLYAKDIVSRMNQTIPPLDYQAGLVVFGSGGCMDWKYSKLVYGMTPYTQSGLASSLDSLECASGITPLSEGVDRADAALDGSSGEIAVIIVSDFEQADPPRVLDAVDNLKSNYGDRVCVYSIHIDRDRGARKLADQIDHVSGCGFATNADEIVTPEAMADYVTRVLLIPGPLDSDGDGVPDDIDQCPDTPPGVRVNAVGCWVLADDNVLFEVDRTEIRDTTMLDEAIEILIANPEITGEIQGHTDNTGPAEYNMGLSLRRAEAVFDYMVQGGVAAERMRVEGYGEERPIASNDTAEGRAQNRRVELHPDR